VVDGENKLLLFAERICGYDEKLGEVEVGLLARILRASTKEGQVVLDAYCGCGTTVAVAEKLKRDWIGIDITYHSIGTVLARLEDKFGKDVVDSVSLDGIPRDMKSATALAHKKDDRVRKEFEKWAILTYTNNGAAIRKKKGADGGIDGVYYFWNDIAALRGDMEKFGAALACLITLQEETEPMRKDAKSAGVYETKLRGIRCDRIRIIRVVDILHKNKRIELPLHPESTNRARRDSEGQQLSLELRPHGTESVPEKKSVASVRSEVLKTPVASNTR
jgi:DNA methylase